MMKRWFIILFLVFMCSTAMTQSRVGYYRYPTLNGSTVVFTSEGDLWAVSLEGGTARRLTTHQGVESNAKFSPDGSLIAFSAQYEGPTEIYTMPVTGGLPTRRTFSGVYSTVVGWTPDGKIIYATQKYSTLPNVQLVLLDIATGAETVVPLAQASQGDFNQNGSLFFTRLPFQGSYTKRYKGGTAQNLWRFDKGAEEAVPLTADYTGTSKDAMWWNGRVYFVSDRDGIMNLWSMREDGADIRQLTKHKEFDVSSPSLHNGKIVYQLVSDLYVHDIEKGTDTKIDVALSSDFDQTREKWVDKPLDYLQTASISPDGDRVAITARGHVFVFPVEKGRIVRVSRDEGVRHRVARFFPDGKDLMVLSDKSGENEFHRFPANGVGESRQLTPNTASHKFDGTLSPDGNWLAYADKNLALWLHNIGKNQTVKIRSSETWMFSDLAWSPDSKWLAFVENSENGNSIILVYDVVRGATTAITNDRTESNNPVWSSDGKWLYFLSDRNFNNIIGSVWGARQPEPFVNNPTKIYALALTPDEWFPFLPPTEVKPNKNDKAEKKDEKKDEKPKEVTVNIVFNGLSDRLYEVPVPPARYQNLSMNDKTLFTVDADGITGKRKLVAIEIKNKKVEAKTLAEDIHGYELSLNGKKILLWKGSDFYVFDAGATAPTNLADSKVDLSKWKFSIQPRAEWRQMFTDAWRLERDYFYDRGMHGVDYEGLFKRYQPLVDRVTDRYELADLLGHLVGELSALHMYVYGGDLRRGAEDISLGSLGALLEKTDGGYRVAHIYKGDPEYLELISPLAKPNVNVKEGDVIVAINGVPLSSEHPNALLRNTVGQQVLLEVKPQGKGASRMAVAEPISAGAEANLRYDEWEYTRRLLAERESNGDIGYVHLRAMGTNNYTEWVKNFYPVYHKKGLIIDVRHNRGGNIDSWILGKLLRKAWFYWQPRIGKPYWNMQYAFRGHMAVLCNERTASDGEAFTEGFRRLGLGKVIGTRTWGGEIWLSSSNNLVDRGIATAAETGVFGPEGEWLIEGHGVEPDTVVDNLPRATFKGKDAQLEAAIKYLKEKIAKEPVEVPKPPAYPKK